MEYGFKLTGTMPLIIHADDVMASDEVSEWRKDPANKNISVAGDDRSPAWTWMTYLYSDDGQLAIPQANLMVALRAAGAKIQLPKGKGSFKSLTQSGLLIGSDFLTFTVGGKSIPLEPIQALKSRSFNDQFQAVKKLGFELSVKRAKVGTKKHVRVRPMFRTWEVSGSIAVAEAAITPDTLAQLFDFAGRFAGLGDWRPSAKESPGPYGMFTAKVEPLKARKAG